VFVIVQDRQTADARTARIWLTTLVPIRWGDRERAMKFHTKGEGRRAAASIKIAGPWFVELLGD
jgi:hypothetical protein